MFPPALFAIYWAGVIGFSIVIRFGDYTLAANALMVFIVGSVVFSMGGFVAERCTAGIRARKPVLPMRKRFIQNCIIAYSVALLSVVPILFLALKRVGVTLGIEEFAVASRVAFGESDRAGLPRYFVSMTSVGMVLSYCAAWLYDGTRRDKIVLGISIFAPFSMSLLMFGRTPIYMLVVGVTGILAFRHNILKRTIIAIMLLGIFLVVLIGMVLGKGPDFIAGKSPVYAIIEYMAGYFVGGPVGFGQVMDFPTSVSEPGQSLRFFTQAYSSLGGNIYIPDIVLGYFGDRFGNVYTIYFAYWLDWGWWGVVGMAFLAGFLCSAIFLIARKGYPIAGVGMGMVTAAILNSATGDWIFLTSIPWLLLIVAVYSLWNLPVVTFVLNAQENLGNKAN